MADTESLRFTVDAKGFLASLGKMERALESLGNKAATSASQLNGAFGQIEKSANKLRTAISQAGRGVGDVAKDYGKLSTALRGINRELDIEKVSDLGDAFVFLNSTLRESGSLQRFADKMGKLQGVLKVIKRDAREAAKSIQILAQAADKNLGAVKQKAQTPAQAERDQVRLETERIRLARERARQEEDAARRLAKANRQAAASTREVATESRRASRQSVGAFKRIEGSVASLRIRLLNLRTAFAFLGGGFLIKKVLGFAGDFEQKLAEVGTIIQDQSEVQLPRYRDQLLELAQRGPQDLLDLSESLYQVISAGIPTIEGAGGAFDVLATAQRASVAGVSSLKQGTDAILTTLNGFRRESLSATEASDKLFATVRLGRTRFELLAKSVGRVAAIADDFGVSSNELLGGLGAITRVIPSTNEAVTQLRALITGIVRPTVRASRALSTLLAAQGREDLQDLLSAGGLQRRGLVKTLEELTEVTGGSSTAIAQLFPNVRALAASAILGGRNFGQFKEIVEGVRDSTGETDRAFGKLQFTFNNVAAVFRNKVATVLIRIGDKVMPKLVALFERLGTFLLKNQDKIISFFETLADLLIGLIDFLQSRINGLIGGGLGLLAAKLLESFKRLLGDTEDEANEAGLNIGKSLKDGVLKALATGTVVAVGAIIGEAAGPFKTDIEGDVAVSRAQPVVDDALATASGFRTGEQFKAGFQKAFSGQALLADTATDITTADFQEILSLQDLSATIENFESFADALSFIQKAASRTASRFETVGDQIATGFERVARAYKRYQDLFARGAEFAPEARKALQEYQEELASFRESLGETGDVLADRSPEIAKALEAFSGNRAITTLGDLANAVADLREQFPELDAAAINTKGRLQEFRDLLPNVEDFLGDSGVRSIGDRFDEVFDPLWQRYAEQQELQFQKAGEFSAKLAEQEERLIELLREKAALERDVATETAKAANAGILAAAGTVAASDRAIEAKKREVAAAREAVETTRRLAIEQERASRNILDGILEAIDEFLRRLREAEKQAEIEDILKGAGEEAEKQRLASIKDNGLIQRILRRITDLEQERLRVNLQIARLEKERAVNAARFKLDVAKTLGSLKGQEEAQRNLLVAQQMQLRAEIGDFQAREKKLKVTEAELQNARELADVTRAVKNLEVDVTKAKVEVANAEQSGDQSRIKAAKAVLSAYEAVLKTAKQITPVLSEDDEDIKAAKRNLQRALDARLQVLRQLFKLQTDEAVAEANRKIALLQAAEAARPNAVQQFEAAVARAKVAALDASQGVETVLRGVVNTARELRATEQQIALGRREATVTGQLGQEFGNALDLAQFKAAREALQEEVQQVAIDLLVNIAQLRKRAAAEQKALQAELAVVTGQRERVDPLLKALGLSDADRLDQRIKELRLQIDNLKASTEANVKQLDAEAEARLAELQLSEQQLQAVQNLIAAEQALAEQTFAAVDSLTFGGASAARFGAAVVDAFSGDAEAAVLGMTVVLETLASAADTAAQKVRTFLPDFGRLIDDVFDSLLQGANSVIDGLSTAFTGVFDILFGGFRDAIQSILGFDFFGDQNEQQRQTIPSVDLRGRFFDQRPEDRARVLAEIRAQGAARDALAAGGEGGQENLSAADLARQTLERAIETAVRATEVIVQILPELLETFLSRVIELLPTLAGRLAQAVAAGIRILADKFDEILVATLDAIGEALPVILEAVGEAIPVIVAQLIAKLPRIVYETLKALGLGVGGLFTGLGRGIASLFHTGGTVRHGQRNPRAAAMMQALGAQGFAMGGTVTLGGLTQQMIGRRLQKDEVPAVLQVGERVVSREELARMGGEAALNRLIENGGLGGGDSYDGVISGISPQAQAAMAAAMAQALRATMGQNVAYNPNAGARVGRGRSF